MKILHEDKFIVVCLKPAGVISQGTDGGKDMISLLDAHFEQNGENSKAYPVQRLDRETAGVMVYAKSSKSAAALSKQIEQNSIRKHYYAVVHGRPDADCGVLKDLLFRDKQKNKTFVVKRERKGVRDASLEYKVIGGNEDKTLLDILLHTGRTHQIRVQFASRKMPLYGDGKYGGGSGELALFAHTLEFSHPVSGEKLVFSAKPDAEEFPWNEFDI